MFKDKKTFSILSIAIIIIAAVLMSGIVVYQSKLLSKQLEPTSVIKKDETAHWKVYKNKDYGFQIKYPRNWECIEAIKIEDPEKTMKGIVGFGPQGKTYYYNSISIQSLTIGIYRGAFEGLYPEFPFTQENEKGAILYGFESPTTENLGVIITDETGFIIEDVAERNELKVIINKMISTFKFFE